MVSTPVESACGKMALPLAEGLPAGPGLTASEVACQAVLARARTDLSEPQFKLWFAGLSPGKARGDLVELIAPSAYVKTWLSGHYMDLITKAVADALGANAVVRLKVPRPVPREDAPAAGDARPPGHAGTGERPAGDGAGDRSRRRGRPHPDQGSLDALDATTAFPDRYTFDTFVQGPSNKFAHAAALAVAEAPPSTAYNPLFVYGGVGLGKTHLLFAIAQHMVALAPRTRVRYVTSEQFVTEFIKAVRGGRGYQFQRQYRDVHVLLLDDVQFLRRAEETQTEFFHTFNHLHQHERQIVIASDRPPQDLGGIEERLKSRFRCGLVVDVQPPDLETRVAILQLKALRDGFPTPDEVLLYIASKFDQNIRELEGALHRVVAFASLSHQPVDLSLAERALEDLIPDSGQETPPAAILEEAAAYFGLSLDELVSKSRSRPLTTARHVAMYLLREQTGLSLIKIGEHFHRDHTTVLHGIKKIEGLMPARGSTYRQVQELTKKIRARSRGRDGETT
jgi:chromosomal replication initiator protein